MKKATLFIGSNNATHELETDKALAIVSEEFDGFTTSEIVGYWKGQRERTLKIEIVTEEADAVLVRLCKTLRVALEQEAVMLEVVDTNVLFVQ